ncbi:hypothetical protein L915_21867 [Phytophthora nicotianae]|uniref:Uncharacterized protein n=1 Tax=Phytophthora nicotianae TaxID=4792 RepID=W2FLJ7_PHYNI|nr:hypothetical protein L915_21867 [Phytophthora nicotianae]
MGAEGVAQGGRPWLCYAHGGCMDAGWASGRLSAVGEKDNSDAYWRQRERNLHVQRAAASCAVTGAFLAQLKRAGSRISLKDLEYNWQRTGHRGIAGIKRLKLEDGFYIVAASNSMGVRHAFVVEVQGHKYTAHDESVKSSLEQYGEWINSLMFVRKVALEA